MTSSSVFSPKLLIGFVSVAVCGFIASLYLSSNERPSVGGIGPTTYSRSAIGYNALAELLPKLNIPVVKSRSNSAKKAKNGLLVLAEPDVNFGWDTPFKFMLFSPKVLVVLPKWTGVASLRPDWIDKAFLQSSGAGQTVLNTVMKDAEFVRVDKVEAWSQNVFSQTPSIRQPVQLVKAKDLRPLIATPQGILLGEIHTGKRTTVWVLSDPDVLSNQGLGPDGKRNAALAVEIIETLIGGSGDVVFDESIHGYISQSSAPWRLIFEFPYSVVTVMALVAIALLLWATMGRFGPHDRDTPALMAGKHGLIDNVAQLIGFAGYEKRMLRRYADAVMRDVARQLHAPKGLSHQETTAWLAKLAKARNVSLDIEDLLARTDDLLQGRGRTSSSAAVTTDIYRWKGEMLNGPSGHSHDH